jgi:hypothetical protein
VRFHSGVAFLFSAFGAIAACSSSPSSSGSAPPSDAAAAACTDSLDAVFSNAQCKCPADSSGKPAGYDTAITATCKGQGLNTGDIKYGQCLDYLVWQQDNDSTGQNFSKCFYDVKSHVLVGIVLSDGMQDQCGGKSATVQGGAAEPSCPISGLTVGGGGLLQSCAPVPEGGADAAHD